MNILITICGLIFILGGFFSIGYISYTVYKNRKTLTHQDYMAYITVCLVLVVAGLFGLMSPIY